ncbi:cyclic nucleotide-binding domain-containing protein [Ghiorsea bivora]|uniref:cyclic nucleotide-binding domain-containing protein n=1 Tax=Ghiorsea bivora TaxID=1485545 RepID=UPI0005716251|nr:cyclic nucleotide-binding domain-containing protein [Ghiorsea bivora]
MANINDEGFLELSGIHQHNYQQQLSSSNFPVLEGLSPLNLRVLNQASQVMNVTKGVEMMVAGDTPHDLYFIAQGSMAVAKKHAEKSLVVATLKAGDFYGEYGVLRGKTRFASVYTAEPSVIIRVGLQAIQQVLDADLDFKSRVFSIMKQRVLSSFLCTHVVFRAFPASVRDTLSTQLTVSELERGETLFTQGESADRYYIILSGEAEVLIQQSGKTLLLEIRRDNDVLGEVRVDKGSKYGCTVVATNQLDLLALDKAAMLSLQQVEPDIVKRLQQFIVQQSKKTIAKIQSL